MNVTPEHLLVVMPSWIGDIVMATPALRALREAHPRMRITATLRPGLRPILEGASFVDAIEDAGFRGMLGPLRDGRRLASLEADTALLLPNSPRSALFARLAGASRRIGYATQGRRWLLTDPIEPKTKTATPTTTLDDYARLIEKAFQIEIRDRTPRLGVDEAQHAAGDDLLRGLKGPFVVLNPGANREDKRWPAESFTAVADHLRARHDVTVLVNGSPAEAELVARIVERSKPGVIDLPARGGSIAALKSIIARSKLLITNDTGPRHLAAGLGIPSVVLFGPTDRRFTVLPEIRERHLVAEPFLTEEHVADDHAKACRIGRISIGDVLHAADTLLEKDPRS